MLSEQDVFDTVFYQMTRTLITEQEITSMAAARNYDLDDLGFQLSYIRYCGLDWQRRIATGTTNIKLYPLIPNYPGDTSVLSTEEYQRRVNEAMNEFDPEPAFPYIREDFYNTLESFHGLQGKHYFTVVDKHRLIKYISDKLQTGSSSSQKETSICNITLLVNELVSLAGCRIKSLLSLCPTIQDKPLRNLLRTGLLAQMYGISETNQGNGSPYFTLVNDCYAILQTGQFSFVLKPDGNMKLTPYHFRLDDSRPSKWGWLTWATINQNQKYGLYSTNGQELLPCKYDSINLWDYETPVVTANGRQQKVNIISGKAVIEK